MTFEDVKLDPALLHELLSYDPSTGMLTWKERAWDQRFNTRWAGKPALNCSLPQGHRIGALLGQQVYAHQVVWAMFTGQWPKDNMDHKNGDPSDNRLENLREATQSQNMMNRKKPSGCSSEHVGVTYSKGKWFATVYINGKSKYLGYFDTEKEAVAVRQKAAEELYGEFAAHLREAA